VRPIGGWISDKVGGSIVTQIISAVMVSPRWPWVTRHGRPTPRPRRSSISRLPRPVRRAVFASGIGNGSTFRSIGVIFDRQQAGRYWLDVGDRAYGAFVAPIVIGNQIQAGTPQIADVRLRDLLWGLSGANWWFYLRAKLREEPLRTLP
jgi:NNP family nitrate/nitrite transporter-like MFS transporter